jgi:hypothetical protein
MTFTRTGATNTPEAAPKASAGGCGACGEAPRWVRGLRRVRGIVGPMAGLLVVAVVVKELRTPEDQRAWHGALFGVVPYDLRRPTLARIKANLWNPDDRRLFPGRTFGVGWSINFHEALARLRALG